MRSWIHLAAIGAALLSSCGGKPPATPDAAPATVPLQPELPAAHSPCVSVHNLSRFPNLEQTRQLPPLQIPANAKVVSRGKPVICSDKNEPFEGALAYVTDGEKNVNEGFSVIIEEGPQWVQIDLGESHLIDAVVLWHYFMSDRVTYDVIVQISEDPAFKNGVSVLFNNDTDNSSGQGIGNDRHYIENYTGRQIPGNGTKARYVRTWSNGSTSHKMNEFIEVEVWGRAVKP